jgi:hypothetical protein
MLERLFGRKKSSLLLFGWGLSQPFGTRYSKYLSTVMENSQYAPIKSAPKELKIYNERSVKSRE